MSATGQFDYSTFAQFITQPTSELEQFVRGIERTTKPTKAKTRMQHELRLKQERLGPDQPEAPVTREREPQGYLVKDRRRGDTRDQPYARSTNERYPRSRMRLGRWLVHEKNNRRMARDEARYFAAEIETDIHFRPLQAIATVYIPSEAMIDRIISSLRADGVPVGYSDEHEAYVFGGDTETRIHGGPDGFSPHANLVDPRLLRRPEREMRLEQLLVDRDEQDYRLD